MLESLLKPQQVAKILNVSLPFVYKLAGTGQLPCVKGELFRHGLIDDLLSPVIEVGLPPSDGSGYLMVTAQFSNKVPNVIRAFWDPVAVGWVCESADVDHPAGRTFEQPSEFLQWQHELFDWIRVNWADKILVQESYVY